MNNILFLFVYLAGMLPTYILPYFGSNSFGGQLVAGLITGSKFGLSWTILHVGALAVCGVAAWARGQYNGRPWLFALPIVAAVFDLFPILSAIPLVPTILHVVTLVFGFMPHVIPGEQETGPDTRLVFLLLVGLAGASVGGAVLNAGYAAAAGVYKAKVEKEERQAADAARAEADAKRAAERAAADTKKASELAMEKEKARLEAETASTKFKDVEIAERAKYDAGEQLLTKLTPAELQSMLNQAASAMNQNQPTQVASLLHVEPVTATYPLIQDALNVGGIVRTSIKSVAVTPGVFKFDLKYPDYAKEKPPTGYELKSENSSMDVRVILTSAKPATQQGNICSVFWYTAFIDKLTGLVKGRISDYRLQTSWENNCK